MAHWIQLPGVSGALKPAVGDAGEVSFAIPGAPDALTGVFLNLEREPGPGESATVEIRTAAGGGGAGAAAVFASGSRFATWTGSLDLSGLGSPATLWLRVVSAGTQELGLSGQVEIDGGDWLARLEDLRQFMGPSYSASRLTPSAMDALGAWKLGTVSQRIRQRTGRHLTRRAITGERHSHDGGSEVLQLREYPVASVQAVQADGSAVPLAEVESLGEDAAAGHLIRLDAAGRARAWESGLRHLVVDYTAGFDPVPADLAEACLIQVAYDLQRTPAAGAALGVRQTVVGEDTATFLVDAWAPEVLSRLRPYVRPVVG